MDLSFLKTFIESEMMPFAHTLGLQVADASPTKVSLALPDKKSNHNHVGFAHAGAQYTLAELTSGAMSFAALADLAGQFDLLMLQGTINYLKRGDGDLHSVAEMSPEKAAQLRDELTTNGRAKTPQRVELFKADGTKIAEADFLVYLRMNQ